MKVLTTQEMQAVDRRTIEEIGIPGVVLMENAGRGVAEEIVSRYSGGGLQCALVIAGKGNNGGDGYVIARHLLDHDWDVLTLVLAEHDDISGDAAVNLNALLQCQGKVLYLTTEDDFDAFADEVDDFSVVVDALFGTGLTKQVQGLHADVISWINCQLCPVVAVDIPSGIDGSTGRILGDAVNADVTVSFAFPKIGQVTYPGARHVGELVITDIGIPSQVVYETTANCFLVDDEEASLLLPVRNLDGHKGTFGHLLVVAGSTGKSGAAAMTAETGLRGGAGLVTLACPQSEQPIVAAKLTEVMTEPLTEAGGELALTAKENILSLVEGKQALAIGPGLGQGEEVCSLVKELVAELDLPMVIDADGLNALAGSVDILSKNDSEKILTPHPGEMARLPGLSVVEVQADRYNVARDFARQHQVVLLLKGARTLVAAPDGTVYVNTTGHAGMASGGMGDVLTGLIGSFLAQGVSAKDAAILGAFLHGSAGERLLDDFGDAGLLATDLMYEIPAARQALLTEG
jgi:NAD(P)H-hydrate epimerase